MNCVMDLGQSPVELQNLRSTVFGGKSSVFMGHFLVEELQLHSVYVKLKYQVLL